MEALAPGRMARFVWRRRLLAALIPPLLLLGALVHELAHALAVIAQGGRVIELGVVPSLRSGVSFGHMLHAGVARPWLVWIAPAALWTVIAAGTLVLLGRIRRRRLAEGLLFVLALLPMADLSFGFAGLFLGRPSTDLYRVLHGHETVAGVIMNLLFVTVGLLGWRRFHAVAPGVLTAAEFTAGYVALLAAPWLLLAIAG